MRKKCKSLSCPRAPNKLNQKGGEPPTDSEIKGIIQEFSGIKQTVKMGAGVNGAVYKVQLNNGQKTAYKFVKAGNIDFLWSEMLEIGMLQLITNTHNGTSYFPELYDWDFNEGKNILWWGMELAEIDLNKLIQDEVLEVDMIHKISFQIARALEFLHKHKFAHCDLKPANIGINPNRDHSTRLLDLGLMKDTRGVPEEQQSADVITRFYRPPEISYTYNHTTRMSTYTTTADMWSLGCIIVEMFTGNPFLQGEYDYREGPKVRAESKDIFVGEDVEYYWETGRQWIKNKVREINSDGTIDLEVRDRVDPSEVWAWRKDPIWPVDAKGPDFALSVGKADQIIKCIDLCLQLGQFGTMGTFIGENGAAILNKLPHINCKRPGEGGKNNAEVFKYLSSMIRTRQDKYISTLGEALNRMKKVDGLWALKGRAAEAGVKAKAEKSEADKSEEEKSEEMIQLILEYARVAHLRQQHRPILSMEEILLSQPKQNHDHDRNKLINDDKGFINNVLPRLFDFDFLQRCSATEFLGAVSESDETLATSYKPIHEIDPDLLDKFRELYRQEWKFLPAQEKIQEHKTFFQEKAREREREQERSHKLLIFAKVLQSPLFQGLDEKIYREIIYNFS